MIDPKTFAASTLQLLQEDPRRYRHFGVHWYLVKAVLKKFYARDNLHLLGDYMDQSVIDRMPAHADLHQAIAAAIEEYRQNAAFNMGRVEVEDPTGGGTFTLVDTGAGL